MEEIQKNIISIIFMYPEIRYLIFKSLNTNHFTSHYKTVFDECAKLFKADRPIDPSIVIAGIGQEYFELILNMADADLLTKSNVKEYIKMLQENHNKINAMYETKKLLLAIEQNSLTQEEIQNRYLEISKMFRNEENKVKSVNMLQGFSELLDDLEKKAEYYETGFKKLDKNVLIDKGDMIVIGGRPSTGKTTLSSNFMVYMAAKYKVDFFSLETSTKKIFHKIAASGARIHLSKILHKNLQDSDYNSLITVANEYNKYNLNVIEASGMSVQEITSKALEDKADIIFIDYLQLIDEKISNPFERVSEISKKLHTFAQKEKVTVIALSQLKRNDNKEPSMSDLRESGQIEQDADVVLLLHNPTATPENDDLDKQERLILIAKNKNGEVGRIRCNFYGGAQTFQEV